MSTAKPTFQRDLDLTGQIIKGNPASWNKFVDEYSDRVWRRSWQLCNEACPHSKGSVYCVFHALAKGTVQPTSDERPGCDEGLEIYAFIFDYLFSENKGTGKLKYYDGRATLDSFVSAVLHGNLRTDWIRHKRRLRVDQITHPPEIQRLSATDKKVFENMVMQRPTETIARKVGIDVEATMQSQERVTHALMANGNMHLILRKPEGAMSDEIELIREGQNSARVLPLRQTVESMWERIVDYIADLPEQQKILLEMIFDTELDAKEVLSRCEELEIQLPVRPRTGNVTIHTIYQSVDQILKTVGQRLQDEEHHLLLQARDALDQEAFDGNISVKGLKALLKEMGLSTPTNATPAANSG